MTDREIELQMRALELDLNKIIQEFYHQKPKEVPQSTWALHALHQMSKKILNVATTLNQEEIKAIT